MRRHEILGLVVVAPGALLTTGVWLRSLARQAQPEALWTIGGGWDYPAAALGFGLVVLGLRLANPRPAGVGPWGPRPR